MEAKKYRVMEITDGHDSRFGKAWVVKANPVEVNPFSKASFVQSEIYEGTETFLIPYNCNVVNEIESIAKRRELWEPSDAEWQTETAYDERNRRKTIVHRFISDSQKTVAPRVSVSNAKQPIKEENSNAGAIEMKARNKKPARQLCEEQHSSLDFIKNPSNGKVFFDCGEIFGYVSPDAVSRGMEPDATIDDFQFAEVSKDGGNTYIPCIMVRHVKEKRKNIIRRFYVGGATTSRYIPPAPIPQMPFNDEDDLP